MPFTFKDSYASAYLGVQDKLMDQLLELSEKEVAQEAAVLKARREAAINQMKRIDDRIFKLRDGITDLSYRNMVDRAKFDLEVEKFNTGKITSSVTDRVGSGGGDGDDDGLGIFYPDRKMYNYDGKQVLAPLVESVAEGNTAAQAIGATGADAYLSKTDQESDPRQLNANAAGLMKAFVWKGKYGEGFSEGQATKAVQELKEYLINEYPDIYSEKSLSAAYGEIPTDLNPQNPTGIAGVKFSRSKTQSYTGPAEKIDVEFPGFDPSRQAQEIEALMAERAQLQSGLDSMGQPRDPMEVMAMKFRRYAPINEPLEGRQASVQSKALSRAFAKALDMAQNNRDSSTLFRGTAVENIDRNALKVETQGKTESQIVQEVVEKVTSMGVPPEQVEQVASDMLVNSVKDKVRQQNVGSTEVAPGEVEVGPKKEIRPTPNLSTVGPPLPLDRPEAYNWATVPQQFAADTSTGGMYTMGAGEYGGSPIERARRVASKDLSVERRDLGLRDMFLESFHDRDVDRYKNTPSTTTFSDVQRAVVDAYGRLITPSPDSPLYPIEE